jgi:hypothetical protein
LYSLAGNYSYLVVSAPNFVEKKFFRLEAYQKNILKIWFLEDKSLQYYLEKFYWSIEKNLESISYLAFDFSDTKKIVVQIASANPEIKKSLKDTAIDGPSGPKQFAFVQIKDVASVKLSEYCLVLIDNRENIEKIYEKGGL